MVAYLVIREGSNWTDVFRLIEGESVTIARAPINRIVLKDDRCSRNHAEIFHSSVGNAALVKLPEYDRLIDEAAVESDPDRRAELYQQAERILVEEQAGTIPIYWYAQNLVTTTGLNRILAPGFNNEFWKWSFDQ